MHNLTQIAPPEPKGTILMSAAVEIEPLNSSVTLTRPNQQSDKQYLELIRNRSMGIFVFKREKLQVKLFFTFN